MFKSNTLKQSLLAQHPKRFREMLCPLLTFRWLAKPTCRMNLKCSQASESRCCAMWDGYGHTHHDAMEYTYKTEFIVRKT